MISEATAVSFRQNLGDMLNQVQYWSSPDFVDMSSGLHRNDCRGCRKALLVIDWTEEADR